jgi:hypothetical protein
VFRHVDGNQYGTLQVFNDVSCGGISGIVGGVARHEGNTFVKQPWIGSADFSIAPNTWYTFSLDLINTMVRWKLQSDQFTEGNVNAFFSDPIWGFLADKVNATGGGGFGFWCSPGATCEFDNAVLFDTAVRAKLTGHLACHYCNFTWPVPSADWCRCCQYSCGGVGESTRDACRANGFCTTANRCQNTADDEKGFPVTFCTPHSITASDKPVVESTAIIGGADVAPDNDDDGCSDERTRERCRRAIASRGRGARMSGVHAVKASGKLHLYVSGCQPNLCSRRSACQTSARMSHTIQCGTSPNVTSRSHAPWSSVLSVRPTEWRKCA